MKVVDNLLSREVDRKQFLIQCGGLVLALIGVTRVLRVMNEASGLSTDYSSSGTERTVGRINRETS